MFALVSTRTDAKASSFKRLMRRFSGDDGIYFVVSTALGVRTLECRIDILQNESLRRSKAKVERALKLISAFKIKSIVPSKEFQYSELIWINKLYVPEVKMLWAKTAGQIASFFLSSDIQTVSVALHVNKMCTGLDEAVRHLLPLTRHLAISCLTGSGEVYAAGLLREFGVPVLTSPSACASADLHLMLHRPSILPAVKSSAIAVQFYNNEYNLPCRSIKHIDFNGPKRIQLPQEFPHNTMLAALSEAGVIRSGDISIKNVLISPYPVVDNI